MVWSVVKWFKPEKGFGFVELSDGSGDAFLHGSVLARSINAVQPGETLEVRVGPGHKGPHVTEVLSVDNSTAVPTTPRRATFQAVISSEPSVEETGTVKWFNVVKGFGWIDGRADGTPAIVCGDFNATLDASSAGLMATRFRPTQTMPTAFTPLADRNGAVSHPYWPRMDRCIDYIWISDGIETLASEVCFNRPSPDDPSLWPSDHAGVCRPADMRKCFPIFAWGYGVTR